VVLKRPANIAFDLPLSGVTSDTEKENIRGRISERAGGMIGDVAPAGGNHLTFSALAPLFEP
jgi:hypothetical protein